MDRIVWPYAQAVFGSCLYCSEQNEDILTTTEFHMIKDREGEARKKR